MPASESIAITVTAANNGLRRANPYKDSMDSLPIDLFTTSKIAKDVIDETEYAVA